MEIDVSGAAVPRLPRRDIEEFVRSSLAALRRARVVPFRPSELSIVLVSDSEMRALNRRFRGRRSTTDVLTFEGDPGPEPGQRPLGEIVISVEQAKRQAREQHHSVATEIRYLLLHGMIHALGYDHETDQGEMNALEMKIRARVGLD